MRQEFQKPAWMNDWKVFIIFSLISFAFAFGLRCLDLPKWSDPSFMVHGEYIMGTHDAYFWLAGAKGVGSAVGNPMSELLRFLGSLTGVQYGNIAFWLPAVFAGFCAIAAFSWGMLVRGPWVGLVSAVYATSIPAYYFRTRLSYYDTDVVTLFFPLLISVLLARWVSLGIRTCWLRKDNAVPFCNPSLWDYFVPVAAGFFTFYGKLWHADILTFGLIAIFCALGLIIVCGSAQSRPELIRGLILYALVAFIGWLGLAVAMALIYVYIVSPLREKKIYNNVYLLIALFIAIFMISGLGQNLLLKLTNQFASYLKPVADSATGSSGPLYPGIAQSVIEAQNISFDVLFSNLTGSAVLGWIGFLCFGFTLLLSSRIAFLLPFVAITFAAITMGGRFSMFGGIALGLGLSFIVDWLICKYIKMRKRKFLFGAIQSFVLITLLFCNIFHMYKEAPPTPIMGTAHVHALIDIGKEIPKDSTIWTWWDWGYATMYYTGVNSFANGGRHGGPVLFPLGFAYATPSYLQSSQLIKFSAANGNNPAGVWDKMPTAQVISMLASFSSVKSSFAEVPKQYFVVSWENIRLAYWILYYGAWNVQIGSGIHPTVSQLYKPFDFNFETGVITVNGESPLQLSSYDFLKPEQRLGKSFPNFVGPHLLYNHTVSQGFMVDDFAYSSMLIRLLIEDPNKKELAEHFKLVYEGFPQVRVYEVL